MTHEERLNLLGLFNLTRRRLRGNVYNHQTLLEVHSDMARGNRHKLEHGKFQSRTNKIFFTMKVVKNVQSV